MRFQKNSFFFHYHYYFSSGFRGRYYILWNATQGNLIVSYDFSMSTTIVRIDLTVGQIKCLVILIRIFTANK